MQEERLEPFRRFQILVKLDPKGFSRFRSAGYIITVNYGGIEADKGGFPDRIIATHLIRMNTAGSGYFYCSEKGIN